MSSSRISSRLAVQNQSLQRFFAEYPQHWERIQSYVEGKSDISLRLWDYFVTEYARQIRCVTRKMSGEEHDIYHTIQTTMRGLNKKGLDPFRRKHTSDPNSVENLTINGVETNVAQLTFFRWALLNGVIDFVESHKEAIRTQMLSGGTTSAAVVPRAVPEIREVVLELPAAMIKGEHPHEVDRLRITLRENLQKPQKKRKRARKPIEGARPATAAGLTAAPRNGVPVVKFDDVQM